ALPARPSEQASADVIVNSHLCYSARLIAEERAVSAIESPGANPHPFSRLSPELVIDAIESTGRLTDLRVFPLNSYENRVYQIGIEDGEPIIAKFYRPERCSDAQILEVHRFSRQLFEAYLPVIPPMANDDGATMVRHEDFRFATLQRRC